MNDDGRQAMAAIAGVRALLLEVGALLTEAARQLDARGWAQATKSRKASHLGNAWDEPQNWLPKVIYRWFYNPKGDPRVYLALVVHLEELDGLPPEPWLAAGALADEAMPTSGVSRYPLPEKTAYDRAAGLHLEEEEGDASGQIVRLEEGTERQLSFAVPLLSVTGPDDLARRVIEPLLAAIQAEFGAAACR